MTSAYHRFRNRLAKVQKTLIGKYARYHARHATPGAVFRIPGRGYRMWLPISWGKTVAQRRFGVFEPWTFHALSRSVEPGSTVIELGACYGEFTIHLSKLVGPKGRVYAFELLPNNFEILTRNIELNRLANVECFNMGVAPREVSSIRIAPDPGHLYESLGQISGRAYTNRAVADAVEMVDVPCVSLLDFAAQQMTRPVDYLFMDIEACEVELFKELEAPLSTRAWRPIIYMETHPQFYRPGDLEYLRETLKKNDYAIEEIGTHWLCRPRQGGSRVSH